MMETNRRRQALVVDDEPRVRTFCSQVLKRMHFDVRAVETAGEGLCFIKKHQFDIALFDIMLPDFNGLNLLEQVRTNGLAAFPIIVMTGNSSIESAVKAMKLGACDYLQKPFSVDEMQEKILESIHFSDLVKERGPSSSAADKFGLIGQSEAMKRVLDLVNRVARSNVTVIIYGESGTGKEMVAQAIHASGPRTTMPFIPVDCSALASSIVESELFGHVKGAFTNAHADREGLMTMAGKGTVFLDEIVELSTNVQARLLRVLQEKVVRPVGASKYLPMEARVVAASNRDLSKAVKNGDFREDLFYRLHVVPIYLPPLRDRKEDIPALVHHFMRKHSFDISPVSGIAEGVVEAMRRHDWPGNVRQLENAIQRMIVLCDEDIIQIKHLPEFVMEAGPAEEALSPSSLMDVAERSAISKAISEANGNKRQAARRLGISKTTLYAKLKKYDLLYLHS